MCRIMFTVGNVNRYIGRRGDRYSIATHSTVDRHSVDTQSIVGRHVGRHSFSVHRYLADTWPILDTIGTKEKITMPLVHSALRFAS